MVSKFHAADGLCIRANTVLKGLVERGHEVHAFTQSDTVDGLPEEQIHRFGAVQLKTRFNLSNCLSMAKNKYWPAILIIMKT